MAQTPEQQAEANIQQRDLSLQGLNAPSSTPAPAPQQSTTSKVVGAVEGAAKATYNWFQGEMEPLKAASTAAGEDIGETVRLASNLDTQGGLGGAIKSLVQAHATANQVAQASQLPTQDLRNAAVTKLGTPGKFLNTNDYNTIAAAYKTLGITPNANPGKQTAQTVNSLIKAVPLVGSVVTQAEQQTGSTARLSKESYDATKLGIQEILKSPGASATKQQLTDLLKQQGIDPGTTSGIDDIKKIAPDVINTAFLIGTVASEGTLDVAADAISGALVKVGLKEGVDVAVRTGGEAAGEDVAGEAANITVRKAGQVVEQDGVPKTVGEELLNDAGPQARTSLLSQTKNGIQILGETAAGKAIYNAAKWGAVNATQSVFQSWADGNNFDSKSDWEDAAKKAGSSFILGGLQATAFSAPEIIGNIRDGQVAIDKVNSSLGTNYSGQMGAVLAKTQEDLTSTYQKTIVNATIDNLDEQSKEEITQAQAAQTGAKNAAKKVKAINRSTDNAKRVVKNTPIGTSYDQLVQRMSSENNVDMVAADPGSQTISGVSMKDGKTVVTYQSGDFQDAFNQLGKTLPSWMKDNGIAPAYIQDELDSLPETGQKDLDRMDTKVATIVEGLNSQSAAQFATNYPKTTALFQAYFGRVRDMTPTEAGESFLRDNAPEMADDIMTTAKKSATSIVPNKMTGGTQMQFDPKKYEKIILDAQDLMLNGKSKTETMKTFQATIDKQDQVDALRNAAANPTAGENTIFGQQGAQQLFQTADKTASAIPSLDGKIKFWNQHLKTFKIDAPDIQSRFDTPVEPENSTSTLGQAPELSTAPVDKPVETVSGGRASNESRSTGTDEPKKEEDPAVTTQKSKTFQKVKEAVGDADLGDGPSFTKEKRAEEAKKATDLAYSDYDQAQRIAMGSEKVPDNFNNPTSGVQYIRLAVMQRAAEEGDWSTVNSMLSSYSSASTEYAKGLDATKALHEDSTSGALKMAYDMKKAGADEKDISAQTGELAQSIRQQAMTDEDSQSFVDKITC